MKYPEFIWKLFGSGYQPLRFFNWTVTNRLKPKKSPLNLHALNIFKVRRLLPKTDRLHLGCGTVRLEGFINIDAVFTPAIDFRCRLNRLYDYFPENFVSEICLPHDEASARPFSPALSETVSSYFKKGRNPAHLRAGYRTMPNGFQKAAMVGCGTGSAQGVLGGGQDQKYNYRKLFFWPEYLRRKLEIAAFTKIEEYPLRPHFAGKTIMDSINGVPIPDQVGHRFRLKLATDSGLKLAAHSGGKLAIFPVSPE